MKTLRVVVTLMIALGLAGTGLIGALAEDPSEEPWGTTDVPALTEGEGESPPVGTEDEGDPPPEGEPDVDPGTATGTEEASGESADEQPVGQEAVSTGEASTEEADTEPVPTEEPVGEGDAGLFLAAQSTEESDATDLVSISSANCSGTVRVYVGEGAFPGNRVHVSAIYTDVVIQMPDGPVVQDWEADLDAAYTGSTTYPFHFYIANLTFTATTTASFQAWAPNGPPDTMELWCGVEAPVEPTEPAVPLTISIVDVDCQGRVDVEIGDGGTNSGFEVRYDVMYDLVAPGTSYWWDRAYQQHDGAGAYSFVYDPPEMTADMGYITLTVIVSVSDNERGATDTLILDCTVYEDQQPAPDPCSPLTPEPTATQIPVPTPTAIPDDGPGLTSLPGSLDAGASATTGQRLSFGHLLLADDCEPDVPAPAPVDDAEQDDEAGPAAPKAKAPAAAVRSGNGDGVTTMPSTGNGTASHNAGGIAFTLAGMGLLLAVAGLAVKRGPAVPARRRG